MRHIRQTIWNRSVLSVAMLLSVVAMGACSDNAEDPAASAAAMQKLYEEEYEPARAKYSKLLEEERVLSEKIIPLRKAMLHAKGSGNESKAAEAKAELDTASSAWTAAKNAFEAQKELFMGLKRKLKAANFDFEAAKQK